MTMLKPDLTPPIDRRRLSVGRFPYEASDDLLTAARVALTLRRPLLLTGEPGCGKTDFATAIASALQVKLHPCYVRSDSRAADLLYAYDALARFGDAHGDDPVRREKARDPRSYMSLLGLGEGLVQDDLSVVLIDEIDKAQRDLPNDLLRELEEGRFTIPEITKDAGPHGSGYQRVMGRKEGDPRRPFVIITSNAERQLPDAFLRRVVFFHIEFPNDQALRRIVASRFGEVPWMDQALFIFNRVRKASVRESPPSTSELLDWVGALVQAFDADWVRRKLTEVRLKIEHDTSVLREAPAWGCLVKSLDDRRALRMDTPPRAG
jgi:MoxR-like ATPase